MIFFTIEDALARETLAETTDWNTAEWLAYGIALVERVPSDIRSRSLHGQDWTYRITVRSAEERDPARLVAGAQRDRRARQVLLGDERPNFRLTLAGQRFFGLEPATDVDAGCEYVRQYLDTRLGRMSREVADVA